MFLTRIGFGSKVIITGDASQKDLAPSSVSGLDIAVRVLKGIDDIAFCNMTSKDVVRHPLVQKIVKAYEVYEAKEKDSAKSRAGNRSRKSGYGKRKDNWQYQEAAVVFPHCAFCSICSLSLSENSIWNCRNSCFHVNCSRRNAVSDGREGTYGKYRTVFFVISALSDIKCVFSTDPWRGISLSGRFHWTDAFFGSDDCHERWKHTAAYQCSALQWRRCGTVHHVLCDRHGGSLPFLRTGWKLSGGKAAALFITAAVCMSECMGDPAGKWWLFHGNADRTGI